MLSITELIDKLTNSNTWNNVFTDPLKMGLLMSAIIILIIFLMFRNFSNDSEDSPGFFNVLLRTAVYVSVANLAMIFLFHSSLATKLEEKNKSESDKKVIQSALTNQQPATAYIALPAAVPTVAVATEPAPAVSV